MMKNLNHLLLVIVCAMALLGCSNDLGRPVVRFFLFYEINGEGMSESMAVECPAPADKTQSGICISEDELNQIVTMIEDAHVFAWKSMKKQPKAMSLTCYSLCIAINGKKHIVELNDWKDPHHEIQRMEGLVERIYKMLGTRYIVLEGVRQYCREKGLSVPEDMQVMVRQISAWCIVAECGSKQIYLEVDPRCGQAQEVEVAKRRVK